MSLTSELLTYRDRIDGLSLRERVLIFLAAASILVGGGYNFVITPLMSERESMLAQMRLQLEQINVWNSELESLARQKSADLSGADKQKRLESAKKEIEHLDARLSERRQQLVTPERMKRLLASLTDRNARLKLTQLNTTEANLVEGSGAQGGPSMYRHGVQLVLSGTWPDVVAYLSTLERLPERVFWGDIELSASYPVTTLKLSLFTYSLETAWISL